LFTDSVFLVGMGWYTIPMPKEILVGTFRYQNLCGSTLFPSKKRVFGPLWEHSAPLLREKGFPAFFSKKEFPETSKKSSHQILQYKKHPSDIPAD
jgi:hypothetical protein